MFRNLFKIEINKKENEKLKATILRYIINAYKRDVPNPDFVGNMSVPMSYKYKMTMMIKILNKVLSQHIDWAIHDDDVEIDELLSCLDMGKDSCEKNVNCAFKDESCKIILPKYNLMYGDDTITNEKIYYKKL